MFSHVVVRAGFTVTGIGARPRRDGSPSEAAGCATETLLFSTSEIYVVEGRINEELKGARSLGSQLPLTTAISKASCPAYEPSSDSVLFVINGTAIAQLDSNNALDLTAGSRYTLRCGGRNFDGRGAAARFYSISALAPDGKGNVYVADYDRIRKLHLTSGEVTTLPGSAPEPSSTWVGLSYDASANVLWAATGKAVCIVDVAAASDGGCGGGSGGGAGSDGSIAAVPIAGGNGSGPSGGTSPRVVAGDWQAAGYHDGDETMSRFTSITAILAGAGRCLYVLDNGMLRIVDSGNWVNTALTGVFEGAPQCLSVLPQGDLAVGHGQNIIVIRGPRLGPSSPALGGRTALCTPQRQPSGRAVAGLHEALTAHAAAQDGAADSAITLRLGGSRFLAHRSVLAGRSEYFRRLLDPEAGFADSGAGEVVLEDADPGAFGWLLTYMYGGELYMPYELLRPAVELAGRLLMPAECVAQLQAWLLAAVTPGSVLSELIWAQQYDMSELVSRLRAYLVRHRREVAFEGMGELAGRFPDLAASLVRELAAAP